MTGIGAIPGIPSQAYRVYQIVTGAARIYRGLKQLDDAMRHPAVRRSPLHSGEDIGLDVAPFGGGIADLLGGMP